MPRKRRSPLQDPQKLEKLAIDILNEGVDDLIEFAASSGDASESGLDALEKAGVNLIEGENSDAVEYIMDEIQEYWENIKEQGLTERDLENGDSPTVQFIGSADGEDIRIAYVGYADYWHGESWEKWPYRGVSFLPSPF